MDINENMSSFPGKVSGFSYLLNGQKNISKKKFTKSPYKTKKNRKRSKISKISRKKQRKN